MSKRARTLLASMMRTLFVLSVARAFAPARPRELHRFAPRFGSALVEPEKASSASRAYPGKVLSVESAGPLSLLTISVTDISGSDLVGRACGSGIVLAARPPLAFALCPSDPGAAAEGAEVALEPPPDDRASSAIRTIPGVGDIALIDRPLLTGHGAIDVLAPLGRGQNSLLVHDGAGDVAGAIRALVSGARRGDAWLHVAYAQTRHGAGAVAFAVEDRVEAFAPPALDDDMLEDTSAAAAAAGMLAAHEAVSWAEDRARRGDDALVVVDDVGVLRRLFAHTTEAVRSAFGAAGVAVESGAEERAFYSTLVQRAAQFNAASGDGSVTLVLVAREVAATPAPPAIDEDRAFHVEEFAGESEKIKARVSTMAKAGIAITPAILAKVGIPVPVRAGADVGAGVDAADDFTFSSAEIDDLCSITDGSLVLVAGGGGSDGGGAVACWPNLDPQRSLTRVGTGADTVAQADAPAVRALAGPLRLLINQARKPRLPPPSPCHPPFCVRHGHPAVAHPLRCRRAGIGCWRIRRAARARDPRLDARAWAQVGAPENAVRPAARRQERRAVAARRGTWR